MPRITRAGRAAFVSGLAGLALVAAGISAASIARLIPFQSQRTDVAAARGRLALLETAVRAGLADQAGALTGSLAAGLGVDTPVELAPELARLASATSTPERELAIARANAILDLVERSPRPSPPWIDAIALLAVLAGTVTAARAMSVLQRSIRHLERASLLHRLTIDHPRTHDKHSLATPVDSPPDYGRIVAIRAVDDR